MAIENHGGTIVVTGSHIELVRQRTVLSMLGLEINTGMKRRGRPASVLANEILVGAGKPRCGTKRNAYEALRAHLIEQGFEPNDERTRPRD